MSLRKVSMRSLRFGKGIAKPLPLDVPFRLERKRPVLSRLTRIFRSFCTGDRRLKSCLSYLKRPANAGLFSCHPNSHAAKLTGSSKSLTHTRGRDPMTWVRLIATIGLLLIPLALTRLDESYRPSNRLDLRGLMLASTGLVGIVWGLVRGNEVGWASLQIVGPIVASLTLLGAFVASNVRLTTIGPTICRDAQ